MLKLNASYSKKVPVEDREYSSQSYHCSVEVELPDGLAPEELDRRIHETFELVRGSVETELGDGGARPPATARPRRGRKTPQPPSARQLAYLRDIAARRGMSADDLDNAAALKFGADSLDRLGRDEVSELIDWLAVAHGTGRAA